MKVSILSQRASRGDQQTKPGGKIRPGIKVLTRTAMDNKQAVKIYNDGVAQRMKFSEIEKKIKDATGINNPMYPRNTPYFNVAASDFGMPEIASLIVNQYGEIREGDNEKRLYRFPVVFHSDDLNEVYPNEFRRYGGEPGYESHYGEDGERYCRYLPEVTSDMLKEQKARRIKRPPRREKVIRGKCDPHACPEFLMGQCKFRGRLNFYIPGIPTTGLMCMETTSEYAAEAIWQDLDRIRAAFGGIPRSNPNKPGAFLFFITKVQEQRTYFDENGQKKIGVQWVPKLQADIDMGTLLTGGLAPQLANNSTPVAWLAAPKGMPEALALPPSATVPDTSIQGGPEQVTQPGVSTQESKVQTTPADPMETLEKVQERMGLDDENLVPYFDLKLGEDWENDDDKIRSGIAMLEALENAKGKVGAVQLLRIAVKVAKVGIPQSDFQAYATMKYGKGFTNKTEVLAVILQDLDELGKSSGESVRAYITAQLENAVPA